MTALLASLPSIALSAWLLIGVPARLSPWFGVVAAVGWFGGGALVVRDILGTDARLVASAAESAAAMPMGMKRLGTAWKYVARGAGVPESMCTVQIVDLDNSFGAIALDRHILIPRRTMDLLTDRQLEAVVAHEFGHALQRATTVQNFVNWYRRPLDTVISWMFRPFHRLVRRFDDAERLSLPRLCGYVIALIGGWLGALGAILGGLWLLLGPWAALLALVGMPLQDVLRPRRAQWTEFHADRIAVDLGYGPRLSEALTLMEGECATPRTGYDHLVPDWAKSHPSDEARLAAMDTALRRWTTP
ncbi:M48 family metalloprotease [Nocardia neocaledoniensis]|uniref:M48 family metalloprotease n=1 Tax=Nocardia neocaledoniensis TaxID=236511 RepID=UPI0024539E12|nr:M48 family metalloprotease [Nocardia neocaledoniensis]